MIVENGKFQEMDLPPDNYKNIATKGAYHLIRITLKTAKSNIS